VRRIWDKYHHFFHLQSLIIFLGWIYCDGRNIFIFGPFLQELVYFKFTWCSQVIKWNERDEMIKRQIFSIFISSSSFFSNNCLKVVIPPIQLMKRSSTLSNQKQKLWWIELIELRLDRMDWIDVDKYLSNF